MFSLKRRGSIKPEIIHCEISTYNKSCVRYIQYIDIINIYYSKRNKYHRDGLPAHFFSGIQTHYEQYYFNNVLHRADGGPADINKTYINKKMEMFLATWYFHGKAIHSIVGNEKD